MSQNLLSDLSKRQISKIYDAGVLRSISREEVVFRKGDDGKGVYLIIDGKVLVVDERDGQMQALARLETGDCFGEMAFFSQVKRSATVISEIDGTLLVLDEDKLDHLVEKNISAKFLVNIVAILANRLRVTNAHYMKSMYGDDVHWVMHAPATRRETTLDR